MKSQTYKMMLIGLVLTTLSLTGTAKTVELTAELDRPVILADTEETVYLRVGLKGCPAEIIEERAPVNVAIVIDKSGSMNSCGKIQAAKEAAILALHRLKSRDIVSVVLYDSDVHVLVPATKMTHRDRIVRKIREISAGGSTALYAGVQTGAEELRKFISNERVNRVVLLSDGLANVGPDSPGVLGKLGADLIDEGISVTTIGMGSGYNEDLMTQLAYKSDGGHYFCEEPDELAGIFDQEFGRALSVVAQKVIIEIDCPSGIKPIRLMGREGTIKGQKITLDMNHIYSEHEKYALLEVQTDAYEMRNTKKIDFADVKVNYVDMKNKENQTANADISITLTDSKAFADGRINKNIRADVIEQIAIENNEKALALRDNGQIEKAKQVLLYNSTYLKENAKTLSSPKLEAYAIENTADADTIENEQKWIRQRKGMRESQSIRRTQR